MSLLRTQKTKNTKQICVLFDGMSEIHYKYNVFGWLQCKFVKVAMDWLQKSMPTTPWSLCPVQSNYFEWLQASLWNSVLFDVNYGLSPREHRDRLPRELSEESSNSHISFNNIVILRKPLGRIREVVAKGFSQDL